MLMEKFIVVTDIDTKSAHKFRKKLLTLALCFPNEPIYIYIDTYGGDVEALGVMVAALQEVDNKIVTIALGKCYSAGAILLSYGDDRFCDTNALVMVHRLQLSNMPDGDVESVDRTVNEVKLMNKIWLKNLANNCRKTLKRVESDIVKHKGEILLTAEDALKYGIVDETGIPENPSYFYQAKDE